MTKIADQVVMVTGASSGIGKACAFEFAQRGARVVLVARTEEKLLAIQQEIVGNGGQAVVACADLTDPKAVEEAYHTATSEMGAVNILINNAGAGNWRFIEETTPEEAMRCMAAPYFSAFYMTRAAVPAMLAAQSGHIVNVTSAASFLAWPGATAYTAARWAMRGFTLALQAELRKTGVRATLATFGKVSSEYFQNNPGSEEKIPGASKLIKVMSPEQVAHSIVKGVRGNKEEIIAPAMLKMFLGLNATAPRFVRWLAESTGSRRD